MNEISMIGLDLAKNVFQVHGVDASGKVVLQRRLGRKAMEKFFAKLRTRFGSTIRTSSAVWRNALAQTRS